MKPWQLRQHDAEIAELRLSGWTLEQIAEKFGATKEGIRYALARHLIKLKKENPEALDSARGDNDQIPEGISPATTDSIAQDSQDAKPSTSRRADRKAS